MSTTTHTPLIRLQAARRNYELACNTCPHWDYEHSEPHANCCDELEDARRELSAARKAVKS